MSFEIHPLDPDYRSLLSSFIERHWRGVPFIVSRGKIHKAEDLKGFVAVGLRFPAEDGDPPFVLTQSGGRRILGMLGYHIENDECEVVTLDSEVENIGVGAALMKAAEEAAQKMNCKRVWLITTNDNTHALRFYQRLGFTLKALYPNALEASRKIKPSIPLLGNDNIPLRDEIELEKII